MSWRVTVPCTRAQGEAIAELELPETPNSPVLVADEPDEARPDEWLIHAYFDHEPTAEDLAEVARLGSGDRASRRSARRTG